jgi:hypothetical protein
MADARQTIAGDIKAGRAGSTPFDEFYDALLGHLAGQVAWVRFVKPGNIIRYDGADPDPDKNQRMDADAPEAVLYPGEFEFNDHVSSTTAVLTQAFGLALRTGDNRLGFLNPIKWAVLCAIADWNVGPTLGRFVTRVGPVRGSDTRGAAADPAGSFEQRGWSTILAIPVEMHFRRLPLRVGVASGS